MKKNNGVVKSSWTGIYYKCWMSPANCWFNGYITCHCGVSRCQTCHPNCDHKPIKEKFIKKLEKER